MLAMNTRSYSLPCILGPTSNDFCSPNYSLVLYLY